MAIRTSRSIMVHWSDFGELYVGDEHSGGWIEALICGKGFVYGPELPISDTLSSSKSTLNAIPSSDDDAVYISIIFMITSTFTNNICEI